MIYRSIRVYGRVLFIGGFFLFFFFHYRQVPAVADYLFPAHSTRYMIRYTVIVTITWPQLYINCAVTAVVDKLHVRSRLPTDIPLCWRPFYLRHTTELRTSRPSCPSSSSSTNGTRANTANEAQNKSQPCRSVKSYKPELPSANRTRQPVCRLRLTRWTVEVMATNAATNG